MTELVRPDSTYAAAWTTMMTDFGGWEEAHGSGYWVFDEAPPFDEPDCAPFVTGVLAAEAGGGDKVPNTHFWIADGPADTVRAGEAELVGYLHLRHELNDFLLEEGGHIGYSVRPARRREGHASRALALGVREASQRGIDRVLVTCDEDNLASAATIERNGGVLEDVRGIKRRYWIATD